MPFWALAIGEVAETIVGGIVGYFIGLFLACTITGGGVVGREVGWLLLQGVGCDGGVRGLSRICGCCCFWAACLVLRFTSERDLNPPIQPSLAAALIELRTTQLHSFTY